MPPQSAGFGQQYGVQERDSHHIGLGECFGDDQPVTVQDDRKRILGDNPAAKKAVTDSMFIRLVVYAYQ